MGDWWDREPGRWLGVLVEARNLEAGVPEGGLAFEGRVRCSHEDSERLFSGIIVDPLDCDGAPGTCPCRKNGAYQLQAL